MLLLILVFVASIAGVMVWIIAVAAFDAPSADPTAGPTTQAPIGDPADPGDATEPPVYTPAPHGADPTGEPLDPTVDVSTLTDTQLQEAAAHSALTTIVIGEFPLPGCEIAPVQEMGEVDAAYLENAKGCLDAYWGPLVSAAGGDPTPPALHVVDHAPTGSACGEAGESDAFYCPMEDTIYFVLNPPDPLLDPDNIAASYVQILAHEYAHHLQFAAFPEGPAVEELEMREGSSLRVSRLVELQAACIANATGAQTRGPAQLTDWVAETIEAADPTFYLADGPHGSAEDQALWSARGWTSGGDLWVCNTYAAPEDEVS